MKYLLILFTLISFQLSAQDVILKKDGSKISAKVIEITSTTIKYRNWDQPDGPIRNISITQVDEIIYDNGTWEKFDKPREYKEVESKPMESPREKEKPNKDPLMSNGFFIDGILGAGIRNNTYFQEIYTPNIDPNTGFDLGGTTSIQETKVSDPHFMISVRLGSKWYFGGGESWRPGLQVNWFRFATYVGGESIEDGPLIGIIGGPKTFSICNVGYANVFKFSEEIGLEANITGGYNLEMYPYDGILTHGVSTGIEAKFRLRKLAIGIDYMHIFGIDNDNNIFSGGGPRPADFNNIGISIGTKF